MRNKGCMVVGMEPEMSMSKTMLMTSMKVQAVEMMVARLSSR